jgi:hypothetical protein
MRKDYGSAGRRARSRPDEPIGASLRLSLCNDALSQGAHARFRAAPTALRPAASQNRTAMYADIDEARAQHAALKQIVERHAGAAADYRALRRVLELCRRAAAAIDDRYCRDKLRLVEDYSAEMLSHGEHRAQYLRQQILDALELYHSRLYSLEILRRTAARSGLKSLEPLRT